MAIVKFQVMEDSFPEEKAAWWWRLIASQCEAPTIMAAEAGMNPGIPVSSTDDQQAEAYFRAHHGTACVILEIQ